MNWIMPASEINHRHRRQFGGKALALSQLSPIGVLIPDTLCISGDVYLAYVNQTGLRERIALELHRKAFSQMRWEEIWDCATRIRSLFLRKAIPPTIETDLSAAILSRFNDKAVVIRSSALDEDSTAASFAGLHDSYLNISGVGSILAHIRLVWASLWSDAALLYRQEIGLDIEKSAMAVIVQELIAGDRSGVTFTQSPLAPSQGVIESVHGLNQGLVDGIVEPDRWTVERRTGAILAHNPAPRRYWVVPCSGGVRKEVLPSGTSNHPPINHREVKTIFETAVQAERFFGGPQDVEWTVRNDVIYTLQSRPVTTLKSTDNKDDRGWYLSLHRSLDNLKALRIRIEEEFIPAMIHEADQLSQLDVTQLSDQDLAKEIKRRWEINHKWVNIYWEEFIPFAHGIRLFGQFYNDTVQPNDPYEFIDLLSETPMVSVRRNRKLEEMADLVRRDTDLAESLQRHGRIDEGTPFGRKIDQFIREYGDLSCSVTGGTQCLQEKDTLITIILEMAAHLPASNVPRSKDRGTDLKDAFLSRFSREQQPQAIEILDLARASYQLRDDDNIYLGKIESQLLTAIQAARRRLTESEPGKTVAGPSQVLADVLADLDHRPSPQSPEGTSRTYSMDIKPRQIVGQPAGPGIARGHARVIRDHADLSDFRHGDIMVCDAVDPNMTFVVPLAAAVVERRGGMLIHGAIIAREYGLPCVTGVPEAISQIRTGDELTVDGYLGIVTVGSGEL